MESSDHQSHRQFFDTPLGQIYYWTAGEGDNLLLVHQSGNSSEEYRALIPFLADRYRLISLDLPGHGLSDDPPTEPTVEDYTAACQQVLNALDVQKAHILGHHGGCLTAMNLLAQEPDRFDKAIFSGIGGLRSAEEDEQFRQQILSTDTTVRAEGDFMAQSWERYLAMASDGAQPKDTLKPYIAFLAARLRPYRGILANLNWDRRDAVDKLKGPVLLVQGEKDGFVHGQESMLSVIPQSSRITMPGCGAFMFYEKPAECAEMILEYLG